MPVDAQPEIARRIAEALTTKLGLAQCADVTTLLARKLEDGAGFVVDKQVRIGEYYDVKPALTIYDPKLGTLAFVETIARSGGNARQAWIAIERATGVRQILLDDADRLTREGHRTLALQVELVLVVSDVVPSDVEDPLRTTLADVARQTGYLRLIGLSILDLSKNPDQLPDATLRRAFAWLLQGTTTWLARTETSPPAKLPWRMGREAFELRLDNYRTPGERRFRCDGTAWLNVVHGHNGSGKSSLVESIELLLTDGIQRLDEAGAVDYFRVLRHRPAGVTDAVLATQPPAEVSALGPSESAWSTVQVIASGKLTRVGASPTSKVRVNSFRIDQIFMDKLIRSNPTDRAALFLDAFSPNDSQLLQDLRRLRGEVSTGWSRLPEHVRIKAELRAAGTKAADPQKEATTSTLSPDEMAEVIIREIGALEQVVAASEADRSDLAPTKADSSAMDPKNGPPPPSPTAVAAIDALLPTDRVEMERLCRLFPSLREPLGALLAANDGATLIRTLATFQSVVDGIFPLLTARVDDLNTAQRIFKEFRSWDAGRQRIVGDDFETDLRRWLDLQALFDLTTKYADMVVTAEAARRNDWQPDELDRRLLRVDDISSSHATELTRRKAELIEQMSDARARVESSTTSAEQPTKKRQPSTQVRRWLSRAEIDALDRVGAFLGSTLGNEPLGKRFNQALAANREEKLAEGTIGKEGGLDSASAEAAELAAACQRLLAAGTRATGAGSDVLEQTVMLVRAARELATHVEKLPTSFFHRITQTTGDELKQLIAAFNELLALITPARWAYRDVEISPEVKEGEAQFAFKTGEGAPAELLFNTAELNASALVLFLLMAPRLPNDLRLLLLDDPLQNMDELTVITLGRALAKLGLIYPPQWSIVAFFHGEDNVERIRVEAPCHVYHLPWLQASESGRGDKTIEPISDENTWPAVWQTPSPTLIADPAVTRPSKDIEAQS